MQGLLKACVCPITGAASMASCELGMDKLRTNWCAKLGLPNPRLMVCCATRVGTAQATSHDALANAG